MIRQSIPGPTATRQAITPTLITPHPSILRKTASPLAEFLQIMHHAHPLVHHQVHIPRNSTQPTSLPAPQDRLRSSNSSHRIHHYHRLPVRMSLVGSLAPRLRSTPVRHPRQGRVIIIVKVGHLASCFCPHRSEEHT